jgi:hypothetical protein
MAKKFLTSLKLVNLPSDPTSGSEGELYFNSSASVAKIYKEGTWSELGAGGGTGITVSTTEPPSPNEGDGWYKNDTGELYIYDGTYWVEVNGVISLTQEEVQDYVAPLFTSSTNSNVISTYDDVNNVINLNTSGSLVSIDSISSPDFIQFDTTANITPVTGLLGWDSVEGTLNLGLSSTKHIHLGEESVYRVRNSTGSTISKGTALYASGVEPSGRIQVTPYVADGSVREVRFMGLATESISNGINGFVQHFGYVRDLDTRGTSSTAISVGDETWGAGDILYVHPTVPGKLTNVKPTHAVVVAIIIIRHQTTGILFVRPSSGGHLEDIHDILISGSVQNNEFLAYDLPSGLWINQTADEAGVSLSSHNHTLDSLSNVEINSLNNGEAIVWNSASGAWINQLIVSGEGGGGATTTVSETAPVSPTLGDTWYRQSDGSFFIYDGSYWVEVNGIIDGLTEDQVQDYASTLFTHGNHSNVTATYNDTTGQIILNSSTQDLSSYLTQSSASTTYLTQASASTNYLTQASASTNYLTQASASTNYLTQASASTNYLTQASASTNYLTQTSASTNYLTQAAGSATYLTISNPVITGVTSINAIEESITLAATSAGGTIVYDVLSNNAITYYTSNASANWTLNIRGNSGTTVNSMLSTGQSLTIAFAVTNGTTAYYQTGLQIDGSAVTPKWQGGSSPTSGNASSIDIYSITIIKTGNAAFTVWESQTRFA